MKSLNPKTSYNYDNCRVSGSLARIEYWGFYGSGIVHVPERLREKLATVLDVEGAGGLIERFAVRIKNGEI